MFQFLVPIGMEIPAGTQGHVTHLTKGVGIFGTQANNMLVYRHGGHVMAMLGVLSI